MHTFANYDAFVQILQGKRVLIHFISKLTSPFVKSVNKQLKYKAKRYGKRGFRGV